MADSKQPVRFVCVVEGEEFEVKDRNFILPASPVKPSRPVDVAPAPSRRKPRKNQWPDACTTCKGDGDVPLTEDDVEELMDEDEFEDIEEDTEYPYCPECIGKGKCPKCAEPLPENWKTLINDIDESLTCRSCGWEDGDDPVL